MTCMSKSKNLTNYFFQVTHCVPVLVAVIIANFVAGMLQPSCYDSIILIKKLPYLPDIIPSSTSAYDIYVESFMVKVCIELC